MEHDILCEYVAGSRLYGLETPDSDCDIRAIFRNTDPAFILGTKRRDHVDERNGEDDILYYEACRFINLIKLGNTQALEVLFMEENLFDKITDPIIFLRENRYQLIDSNKLFRCLMGYAQAERRLANGVRRGAIGGKRYAQVLEFGFSPKNWCQLLRLLYLGQEFFSKGKYPVNIKNYNHEKWYQLFNIKTDPASFTKEELNELADKEEIKLKNAFDNRENNYSFDEKFANDWLLKTYLPFLKLK